MTKTTGNTGDNKFDPPLIKSKNLSDFWQNRVSNEAKHFYFHGERSDIQTSLAKRYLINVIIHKIATDDIVVDWGIGGGLIAGKLPKCKLVGVDICQDSIAQVEKYLGDRIWKTINISKRNSVDKLLELNIKVILSTAVIQHFPTIQYWLSIVDLWKKIKPDIIAIQTREGDVLKISDDYEFKKNFYYGLILPKKHVLDVFSDGYNLISYQKAIEKSEYGYYVFERKNG